jgi:hypothetical protein
MVASRKGPVRVRRRPDTWELGRTTTSGSPAAGADIGVCRGRPRLGALCRLDKAHTRAPLWRACGRRLLAGSRRTSVKARTAGGGPPLPASVQRHGGACSPPACAGAGGSAQLPRREPMSVPAHPAAASARVSLQGLRLRERTASRLPSDGVLPSSRRRRQTTSPRQASAKRLVR